MKRLTLLLAAVFCFAAFSIAQSDYTMFRTLYLTPDNEQLDDFAKGLANYTKKFANEVPDRTSVWMIYTGPNTGKFHLVSGPATFSDLDNFEYSDARKKAWREDLVPYVEEFSHGEYWRLDDKRSYADNWNFTGKQVVSLYGIKDFAEYRFKDMLEKVKKVYEEKEYEHAYGVYYSQFDGCPKRDVAIVSPFEKWADFDEERNFKADFEDVHGEGSWSEFMREYKDVVESNYDEVSIFLPELSPDREEE